MRERKQKVLMILTSYCARAIEVKLK